LLSIYIYSYFFSCKQNITDKNDEVNNFTNKIDLDYLISPAHLNSDIPTDGKISNIGKVNGIKKLKLGQNLDSLFYNSSWIIEEFKFNEDSIVFLKKTLLSLSR
jgi:hypothetical protein